MVGLPLGFLGWIDEYLTVVKGSARVRCKCGSPVLVNYRKELRKNARYEFVIQHRSKVRKFSSTNPQPLDIFDRMLKVASYAKCDFMGRR